MTPTATVPAATTWAGRRAGCRRRVVTGMAVSIARAPRSDDGPVGTVAKSNQMWPLRIRRLSRAGLRHWGLDSLIEATDLLVTELVTNALEHGRGDDIGVRLYVTGTHLHLEVKDGSPEHPVLRDADPLDEDGRGLFLVDAIADSWGTSDDGTITWCCLPLHQEPDEAMQSAAVSSPIVREWSAFLPSTDNAVPLACTSTRTHLTVLRWHGNIHGATEVVRRLVSNAVKHGAEESDESEIVLRLAITEAGELVAEVSDPNPGFPDFKAAAEGERGRGLWEIRQLGGRLSWFMLPKGGKTVQARVEAGEVPA